MENKISVYNSLSRKKELFEPITDGKVGMYVCGPTVYSAVHIGNCLTFTRFDIIYRYLLKYGYKVRFVRNITDVGHLLDDGEDRVSKGARLEQLEPMEVVQKYTNDFHDMMRIFNNLNPSIEPRATAHIIEQINMTQEILDNGYAYVSNGSVYFDTHKFAKDDKGYGKLSGRIIDDLMAESRDNLKNQDEKRHPSDFALWMKAADDHLMHWPSPWSEGFPGWHMECSVMSTKYLGEQFDIHGGGTDLKFPHHENEIAQNVGCSGTQPARYWLHTNMLLMNGRKMSKSDGNTITPEELFTGNSPHVSKGYHPIVVRFFMLQSHYRSNLDLTDDGLIAAEKGFKRLMEANKNLNSLESTQNNLNSALDQEISQLINDIYDEMNDDFNTPKALAKCFELVNKINALKDGHLNIKDLSMDVLSRLRAEFRDFIFNVLGLIDVQQEQGGSEVLDNVMDLVIDIRQMARANKDWGTSDKIRDALNAANIVLKDGKDGTDWTIK